MRLPRWAVYLLALPAGAVVGAVAFYLGAIACFGLGIFSHHGIGRYWWQSVLMGATFGLLQAPLACSLRTRARLAVALAGLVMFLAWLPISLARRPFNPGVLLPWLKMTVGYSLVWGLAGALTAHWTLSTLHAMERGVHASRPSRTAALAAVGIALLALGILAGARRSARPDGPKQVCERFARAFAAGDAQTVLSMFNPGAHGGLNPSEAMYWFDRARPFLPVGGRVEIVQWPYFRPKAGRCVCRARVQGATYRLPPTANVQGATFEVMVQRYRTGWKVDPPERAIETYLASLYGEEAGRAWQRFLLTTPVP